jgi:hypothetical protein
MKKLIYAFLLLLFFAVFFLAGFSTSQPRKKSNILIEKTRVEKTADNKVIIHIPMATLPMIGHETSKKKFETLLGNIAEAPSNEKDPKSPKLIILQSTTNEQIVLTNIPYVHTIQLVYLNKNVMLKGNWLKNAVIFGKEYKSFWVEEVESVK